MRIDISADRNLFGMPARRLKAIRSKVHIKCMDPWTSTSAIVLACAFPHIAIAQTKQPTGASQTSTEIPDIIVTAEKRATNLQRTPVAISALNSDQLAQEHVRDLRDISAIVPSFKASESEGFPQITVRGIGILNFTPLAEGAVAVNVNEVNVSRPSAALTSMFDLSTLEVLRGPQGTLFGRNATAGAINMTSTRPTDELSGYAHVTVGNYDEVRAEAAVGGAIVPGLLSARIAAFDESRGGYGVNRATDTEIDDKRAQGVRGTILLTPATGLKITTIAEYYNENDHNGAFHYFGDSGTIPGMTSIMQLTPS
jgi:iron complex outermembrane receptor protein